MTQQFKLFPLIATYFAFQYSATWLWNVYNEVNSEMEAGQLESLPELHAIACCLKAVSTTDAASGVETCRLACGGHGYMTSSNFPATYGLVTAMCTYEGENTVLLLQTARYLVKAWQNRFESHKLISTVQYLVTAPNNSSPYTKSVPWIISVLKQVSRNKLDLAYRHINERVKIGQVYEDAWNCTSIELVAAAEAHCRVFIVETYYNAFNSLCNISDSLRTVLCQLMELYVVHTALKSTGDLLRVSTRGLAGSCFVLYFHCSSQIQSGRMLKICKSGWKNYWWQ